MPLTFVVFKENVDLTGQVCVSNFGATTFERSRQSLVFRVALPENANFS